jgi:hypothetical protein
MVDGIFLALTVVGLNFAAFMGGLGHTSHIVAEAKDLRSTFLNSYVYGSLTFM